MKKLFGRFLCLLAAVALMLAAVGCVPATEYDDKTVEKIVRHSADGMTDVPFLYERVYDFRTGQVIDDTVANVERIVEEFSASYYDYFDRFGEYPAGETPEEYEARMRERFNHPKVLAEFSQEDGEEFLKKVISLGIYHWEDSYDSDKVVYDGAGFTITICFSDGTEKGTSFYFEEPSNFKKIAEAFERFLGVPLFPI